jgi:CHASE3 domain sensor protein
MQSTHDHGGGKNSQHGKSEDRPSDLRRLAELQEQLKNAQGKEKKAIQVKINRLREEIAKRRKGENHSQKPKK